MLKHSPFRAFPVFNQLTNFIVPAMMALLGSASPALLASDTASPNGLRQGSGVNSITWCTFVTSRPCSRYKLEERCGQQDLVAFHVPDQAATGLSHNIVLLGVRFHEVSNIIATDFCVLKDRTHLAEFLFQVIRYTNIHFHAPKQTLISHLAQYPRGTHNLDLIEQSLYFGCDETL